MLERRRRSGAGGDGAGCRARLRRRCRDGPGARPGDGGEGTRRRTRGRRGRGAGDRAVELLRDRIAATQGPGSSPAWAGSRRRSRCPRVCASPSSSAPPTASGPRPRSPARMGRLDTIGLDLVAMCADDVVLPRRPPAVLPRLRRRRTGSTRAVASLVGGRRTRLRARGVRARRRRDRRAPRRDGARRSSTWPASASVSSSATSCYRRLGRARGTRSSASAASGLHSNGYSLVRAVIASHGLGLDRSVARRRSRGAGRGGDGRPMAGASTRLRRPSETCCWRRRGSTRRDVLALRDHLAAGGLSLHGLAHITGGGLAGNVPRALPPSLGARVDPSAWPVPPIIRLHRRARGHGRAGDASQLQRRHRHGRRRRAGGGVDRRPACLAAAACRLGRSARSSRRQRPGRRAGTSSVTS